MKLYLELNCSDEHGDRPRPLPIIQELKKATDITERKESPAWDYDVCISLLYSSSCNFLLLERNLLRMRTQGNYGDVPIEK